MRRTFLTAALALTCLGLALPALASANSAAGNFYYAIGSSPNFSGTSTVAQRNSYVILQAWKSTLATQLKAANPGLKVLVYQDASAMSNGGRVNGWASSGVGYDEADTAHPDWFLLNKSGGRIPENSWPWLYLADVGSAGYQQRWADNVTRLLQSGPWDGVFLDDTNPTTKYHTNPSNVAKYPNDTAYQSAMRSFLAYVGPRIQAAGKLAISNMGAWVEYPTVVSGWLQYVDGGMDEMFGKWSTTPGDGYRDPTQWRTQLGELQGAEAAGKSFLAVTQSSVTDTQAQRFGWGTLLLGAGGHASFYANYDQQSEPWLSDYDTDLGSPTSAASALPSGAYVRSFSRGLVVVNPTGATQHVDFGGSYSGDGLSDATGANMPSKTALILTGSGASVPDPVTPPPPPPPPSPAPPAPKPPSGTGSSGGSSGSGSSGSGSTSGGSTGSGRTGGSTSGGHTSHHRHHSRTSRRVRTHRVKRRVVVKATCTGGANVRLDVDGRTVLRRRVHGGAHSYAARLLLRPGTHRVTLTATRATGGCAQALTARRVRFA
jgi:hypothetical protein